MNMKQLAFCLSIATMTVATAAQAETGMFSTASMAQTSCGSEPVVWIDLDHGRYYKIGQIDPAKTTNGVYACEHAAHAKYREGKAAPTSIAPRASRAFVLRRAMNSSPMRRPATSPSTSGRAGSIRRESRPASCQR